MEAAVGRSVIIIAMSEGRDYITPEDVSEALVKYPVDVVRKDVLAVLGKAAPGFGAEDSSLCAFVAWKGRGPLIIKKED